MIEKDMTGVFFDSETMYGSTTTHSTQLPSWAERAWSKLQKSLEDVQTTFLKKGK